MKRFKKIGLGFLLALTLSLSALTLALPKQALAWTYDASFGTGGTWSLSSLVFTQGDIDSDLLDADYVASVGGLDALNQLVADQIVGQNFIDADPSDDEMEYLFDGNGCSDSNFRFQENEWKLVNLRIQDSNGNCEDIISRDLLMPLDVDDPNAPEGTPADTREVCEDVGATGFLLCPALDLIDGAMNWVDTQIQNMLQVDENKYTSNDLKSGWSSIRNIAYIILIPIMLVMVISTALGFEMFSAYTVKKALPRMVIAIIFITLSWYICTFMVGFFNSVGSGVMGILTYPFRTSDIFPADSACRTGNLNINCLVSAPSYGEVPGNPTSLLMGIVNSLAGVGAIVGLVIFLVFFGGTLMLGAGAAFLVLLLRQMFIVGLMLAAPLAILAWIFPGNDKLWKLWWGAFTKLLMMFPLIMGIIAIGRIFAAIIAFSPGGGAEGAILAPIMKIGAYFIPYAFIPFTFKFAGGMFANIAGVVNDKNKGLFDRAKEKRSQRWKRNVSDPLHKRMVNRRYQMSENLNAASNRGSWARRKGLRGLARVAGGYRPEAAMSAMQAQATKEWDDETNNGPDDVQRALTAWGSYQSARTARKNWAAAVAAGRVRNAVDADGNNIREILGEDGSTIGREILNARGEVAAREILNRNGNAIAREDLGADGKVTNSRYKTLGDKWASEANVQEANRRWGNDAFRQQAAVSYEMKKAIEAGQVENIREEFSTLADSLGMSEREANGAWIGAGFRNQDQHLEFKHTSWRRNADTGQLERVLNGRSLVSEMYNKRGSYNMSQLNAETFAQLRQVYDEADMGTAEGQEIRGQIEDIANSFMHRYETGTAGDSYEIGPDGQPIPIPQVVPQTPDTADTRQGRVPGGRVQASVQGAPRTAQMVRDLAVHVGVYAQSDPATNTNSGTYDAATNPGGQGTAPRTGENRPRQQ